MNHGDKTYCLLCKVARVALLLCALYLTAGAPAFYSRRAAVRLCRAYNLDNASLSVTPFSVRIGVEICGAYTEISRPVKRGTDLGLYELCGRALRAAEGGASLSAVSAVLEGVRNIKRQKIRTVFGSAMACGAFCAMFGGGLAECAAAVISGIVCALLNVLLKKYQLIAPLVLSLCGGAVCTVFSFAARAFFIEFDYSLAALGAVMPIIPGIKLCASLCDIFFGDIICGGYRLACALVQAAAVSSGFAIFYLIVPPINTFQPAVCAELPLCAAYAFFGAAGFALMLSSAAPVALCGAAVAAAVNTLFLFLPKSFVFFSLFAAVVAAYMACNLLKLFVLEKAAVLIVALIPLVPGGMAYLSFVFLLCGNLLSAFNAAGAAISAFAAMSLAVSACVNSERIFSAISERFKAVRPCNNVVRG